MLQPLPPLSGDAFKWVYSHSYVGVQFVVKVKSEFTVTITVNGLAPPFETTVFPLVTLVIV